MARAHGDAGRFVRTTGNDATCQFDQIQSNFLEEAPSRGATPHYNRQKSLVKRFFLRFSKSQAFRFRSLTGQCGFAVLKRAMPALHTGQMRRE